MILQPVPYTNLIVLPIQNFNPHLLQDCGIGLFMKEIISQKFHHISFPKKHLQILERGLGSCILVIGRHIMIHHQDNLLSHAPLSCPKRIRIPVVLTLFFQLDLPFLL